MRRRDRDKGIHGIVLLFVGIALYVYYTYGQFLAMLLVGISVCVLVSVALITNKVRRDKYLNSGIKQVDQMTGEVFERFVLAHYEKLGYRGEVTQKTNDYGADLVLKKDQEKIVVQAKRWREKVGIKAVQEVIGAMSFYKATKGMVITNSYFTKNAVELAQSAGIELWDRDKLIKVMAAASGKELSHQVSAEQEFLQKKDCPKCGKSLVKREGKNGPFIGCANFPSCKYTENI